MAVAPVACGHNKLRFTFAHKRLPSKQVSLESSQRRRRRTISADSASSAACDAVSHLDMLCQTLPSNLVRSGSPQCTRASCGQGQTLLHVCHVCWQAGQAGRAGGWWWCGCVRGAITKAVVRFCSQPTDSLPPPIPPPPNHTTCGAPTSTIYTTHTLHAAHAARRARRTHNRHRRPAHAPCTRDAVPRVTAAG